MKKTIQLTSGKEIHLDTTKIPQPKTYDGSEFLETSILDNSEIYVAPPVSTSNSVRSGSTIDTVHGDRLAANIENNGIDYGCHPPYVVKEDTTCPTTSKKYQYKMKNVGNHRHYSFGKIGATHWIYNIYKSFNDQWSEIDVGFLTNNHNPQLSLDKNTITNNLNKMVKAKRWGNINKEKLEQILKDYLAEKCSSLHPVSAGHIVKNVFNQHAEYTDHVEYTPQEAEQWVSSYTDRVTDFKIDKKRKVHGTVVGEGYEKKKIMLSIMKYGETKLPTEFVGHVKQPLITDKSRSTTKLKREAMSKAFKDIELDLDSVFKYREKYGKYPWKLVSFIAQDRKNKENFEKEQTI